MARHTAKSHKIRKVEILVIQSKIYGCNATGKTNLGKALLNITLTMFGIIRYTGNGILLNADSKEDAATFQYEFQFDDTELSYKY